MYNTYGNTEELRQNVTNRSGKYHYFIKGPEDNGRATANWKLFHEGIYVDQRGNQIEVKESNKILEYAESKLGCAYVWGATGPDTFDCSGFTQWCYKQVGINIPHYSGDQKNCAPVILPVTEAQPGDILWKEGHVGLFVKSDDNGTYIHAPKTGDVIKYSKNAYGIFTYALRYQ